MEFAQTHWPDDANEPSHPFSSCPPAFPASVSFFHMGDNEKMLGSTDLESGSMKGAYFGGGYSVRTEGRRRRWRKLQWQWLFPPSLCGEASWPITTLSTYLHTSGPAGNAVPVFLLLSSQKPSEVVPFVQMLRECRQLIQGPVVNDASLVLSPDWTYRNYEQSW